MSDSLFTRAKAVLAELEGLAPAEQRASLGELCAGDAALRDEVLSLLEHAESTNERLNVDAFVREMVDGLASGALPGEAGAPRHDSWLEDQLRPGRRLAGFTLGERLGVGGMGVVFEAEQDEPRRRVALKLLTGGSASEELTARFQHEVHVLGRLDHPGIAALYEAGSFETESGPRPFFAMQLVRGVPLTHWVRAQRPSLERVVELLAEVCEAVAHAHAAGVVHRDLKPANILVDEAGRPTVLDFGVARLTDAHTQLTSLHTETGQVLGTLPYMSPEQVAGEVESVEARSDVYSLGVLLFEALTDELPLDVEGLSLPAAALAIQRRRPRRLSEFEVSAPRDLEVLIDKALAKRPRDRYSSAASLGADLRRFLGGRTLVARPLPAWAQLLRTAQRHRAFSAGLLVALGALITALVVSMAQRDLALEARRATERENARVKVGAAASALDAYEPAAAAEQLATVDPERRGWEWHHLAQRLRPAAWVAAARPELAAVAFAATPGAITELSVDGRVLTRALESGATLHEQQLGVERVELAQLSRDGRRGVTLSSTEPPRVEIWDTQTGEALASFDALASVRELCMADDGASAVWKSAGAVWVWLEGADVAVRQELEKSALIATSLQIASGVVGFAGKFGLVEWKDARSSSDTITGKWRVMPGRRASAVAIDSEAAQIAVAFQDGMIRLLDPRVSSKTSRVIGELTGHRGVAIALAYSADGTRLVSLGGDHTLRLWDVAARRQLAWWPALDFEATKLEFDDAQGLVSARDAGGAVRVWDLRRGAEADVLRGHESYVYDVVVTSEGAAVSGGWDGRVLWWDLRSAQLERQAAPGWKRVYELRAAPHDERVLARADSKIVAFGPGAEAVPTPLIRASFGTSALAWVDGGAQLLVGTGKLASKERHMLRLYDAASGELLSSAPTAGRVVRALALSPDESRLLTGSTDGRVELRAWPSAEILLELAPHAERVSALAFSPDGRLALSSSEDGTARVVDARTGEPRLELGPHPGQVWDAAWSPDGERVFTACHDGIVRVFDAEDGALLLRLRGHEDYVHALAFAPDGSLVTGSGDGTVRVWHTRELATRWERAER